MSYCQRNGILINAYSPYGVPDAHAFPAAGGMTPRMLDDPVLGAIAAAHGRSPAAVVSAWLYALGIVLNPRTYKEAHMAENLQAFDIALNATEVALLSARPQGWCSLDPAWYECAK